MIKCHPLNSKIQFPAVNVEKLISGYIIGINELEWLIRNGNEEVSLIGKEILKVMNERFVKQTERENLSSYIYTVYLHEEHRIAYIPVTEGVTLAGDFD